MGKKYALDLSNTDVLLFMQDQGISPEEILYKKLKDFHQPGLPQDIIEARFNYHSDKIQEIRIQYRAFLNKKNQTQGLDKGEKEPFVIVTRMPSVSKTPTAMNYPGKAETFSKIPASFFYSQRKLKKGDVEDRTKKIQELLESKVLVLKKSFEQKKIKQLERLGKLEFERQKKHKKLFEKLINRNGSFSEKVSKSVEIKNKRLESSRMNVMKDDEENQMIKNYLEKFDQKQEEARRRSENDHYSKSLKAKNLRRNMSIDKKEIEDHVVEDKLKKILDKLDKVNQQKKKIDDICKYKAQIKKDKEENKKKEVLNRITVKEQEFKKRIQKVEKKINTSNEKLLEEKIEKIRTKAVQNEIEFLSAKTRIDRINSKFTNYKSKLFEEQKQSAKRIEIFVENRKAGKSLKSLIKPQNNEEIFSNIQEIPYKS